MGTLGQFKIGPTSSHPVPTDGVEARGTYGQLSPVSW